MIRTRISSRPVERRLVVRSTPHAIRHKAVHNVHGSRPDCTAAQVARTGINMAKQLKDDAAIDEIKALEDRRYRAMLAADTAVLNELCSDDLINTHSKADYDDKHKVGTRYYLPRDHTSVRPHSGRRRCRARDRADDAYTLIIATSRSGCASNRPARPTRRGR